MSMAIYSFIEYTVRVGAVSFCPSLTNTVLGSGKNEKRQRVIWTCPNVCNIGKRI